MAPLLNVSVNVQLVSVPTLPAASSNAASVHVPFGLPVNVVKKFSGRKVPVNGAAPADINGAVAFVVKTVLMKLSPSAPLSATKAMDCPATICFKKVPFGPLLRTPPGRIRYNSTSWSLGWLTFTVTVILVKAAIMVGAPDTVIVLESPALFGVPASGILPIVVLDNRIVSAAFPVPEEDKTDDVSPEHNKLGLAAAVTTGEITVICIDCEITVVGTPLTREETERINQVVCDKGPGL